MSGTRLTEEQKAQIVAAYAAGQSAREIGGALGVAHTTVARLVARDPVVRRRVDAAAKRLQRNEARDERRVRAKLRESNDPGISAADRPELAGAVPPPSYDSERGEYVTPGERRSPGATPSGGTRVVRLDGPTVFDPPLAFEHAARHGNGLGPFTGAEPPRWYLDERDRLVTLRDGKGRTQRVHPDDVDAYRAEGWK